MSDRYCLVSSDGWICGYGGIGRLVRGCSNWTSGCWVRMN